MQTAPAGTVISSVRRTSWSNELIMASACYSDHGEGPQWKAEHYSYVNGQLDAIRAWAMHFTTSWSVLAAPYAAALLDG